MKSLLNLNATLKGKWTHCFLITCIGSKTRSICLLLIWLFLGWITYKLTTLTTPLNLLYSSLHTFGSRGPIRGCVGVGFRIGLSINFVVSKGFWRGGGGTPNDDSVTKPYVIRSFDHWVWTTQNHQKNWKECQCCPRKHQCKKLVKVLCQWLQVSTVTPSFACFAMR